MVQRVTVSPSEVRGYGDIVSPKTTEDFTEYMSNLTESDGVYTLGFNGTGVSLTLTASPSTITIGESVELTATLMIDGEPAESETVTFYNDGVSILGVETDETGKATLTVPNLTGGTHSLTAIYDETTSNAVSVTVNKHTSTITVSADSSTVPYGTDIVLSGELNAGTGQTILFYDGVTHIGSTQTVTGGTFTKTISGITAGVHTLYARFNGDEYYDSAEDSVEVTVTKLTPTITLSSNKSVVGGADSFTLSGVLSVGSGVAVKLYDNNVFVKNLATGTGGAFSETISNATAGAHTYKVVFEGNASYESVTSSNVSVTVLSSYVTELGFTGNNFITPIVVAPFSCTGDVFIDWDDNTALEQYNGGRLSHSYNSSGDYAIKIYGNISSIEDGAFENMYLTSVDIPSSVTSIGDYSFSGCSSLSTVNIPNGFTSLGEASFINCTGLTSIDIPLSVTSIGEMCFYGASNLYEVVLNWESASTIIPYDSSEDVYPSTLNHFLIPEGTKALYEAKNYPSALLKEDGEPTPATITLTGTKNILSYADSESSVLTATVLDDNDDPVEGVSVDLYKDSVLWDTLTTGSAGTVSKTYTSAGVGDVGFTAECGSLVTETYSITDAKYYADNTRINSLLDSNRRAFINYTVEKNDMVKFKFNTKPTHCLMGIGTSQSSCFVMEFSTSQTKIHRSSSGTSTYNSNWLDTHSEIGLEIVAVSSSSDKGNVYFEGTYADNWGCKLETNNNGLRVDKFTNDDFNIEIIVL